MDIADSVRRIQNKHQALHEMVRRDYTTIDGTLYSIAYETATPTFTGVIGGLSTSDSAASTAAVQSSVTPSSSTQTSAAASNGYVATTSTSMAASVQSNTSNVFSQILASSTQASQTSSVAATSSKPISYSASPTTTAGSSSSDTTTSSSTSDAGMSTAGKAGLAVGVIIAIGAVLALVLFLLNKKKRQVKADQAREDSEKNAAIATANKPAPNAPRLSLRPSSSFLPGFMGGDRPRSRLSGNMLGGPSQETKEMRERYLAGNQQSIPMTEKASPTENPFKDPENPFADPVRAAPQTLAPVPMPVQQQVPSPAPAPIAMPEPEPEPLSPLPIQMPEPETHHDRERIAAAAARSAVGNDSPRDERPGLEPIEMPSPPINAPAPLQPQKSGPPPSAPEGNVYRILMDFMPSMDDELELRTGQVVRLLHEYDDGWCLAQRLDKSHQGAVPRTCLAAKPSKPRPAPGQGPRSMSPAMGRPGPNGRPMSPAMRSGPPPPSRAMSPAGMPRSMSPGPQGRPPMGRAMSPAPRGRGPPPPNGMRSMSPGAYNQPPRPLSPGPRSSKQRSMSPGPYGHTGGPSPMAPSSRRRSNSSSQTAREVRERRMSPPGPSPLNTAAVPGMAM